MGELLPKEWLDVAHVLPSLSDGVLSMSQACAQVRNAFQTASLNFSCGEEEIVRIIRFWSRIGEIFVYQSLVLRDPRMIIDLLRPLMHHHPMQMLLNPEHPPFLVDDARLRKRHVATECLRRLALKNEIDVRILDLMTVWQPLSDAQREEMLAFFVHSMLLCRIANQVGVLLVSARTRSLPGLHSDVAVVVARASHVALYLLPISHIGIIPQMISRSLAKKFTGSQLFTRCGGDTLLVHRQHSAGPCCSVHLFSYAEILSSGVPHAANLVTQVSEIFSSVLCIASSDFGLFKFMVKCADETLDSCSFGARFESWSLRLRPSRLWVQFRNSGSDAEAFDESSLTGALCKNMHEMVAGKHATFSHLTNAVMPPSSRYRS
jgi:hypothetical protein